MTKALPVLITGLVLLPCVAGADTPTRSEGSSTTPANIEVVCKRLACRTGGFEVAVAVDADHVTTVAVTHSPYVTPDGAVLIFPGETIAVQFAPGEGILPSPKFLSAYAPEFPAQHKDEGGFVDAADSLPSLPSGKLPSNVLSQMPPGTLVVSYGQYKGGPGMLLNLEQNFSGTMKLDAFVSEISSGEYKWHYATTCPLMPSLMDLESWHQPLGPILLQRFRLTHGGSPTAGTTITMTCD